MASDMRSYACAYIYSEHSSDILKKSSLQAHTIFTPGHFNNLISAANRLIGEVVQCTITEKAPTRAFSWLKAPTSAFTFKTLLRHYAKQALTPR